MIEIFTSLFAGGTTGLIGSIISRVADFKLEKMRFSHELEMTKVENEQIRLEAEFKFKVVDRESDAAEDVAASQALSASYRADSAAYLPKAKGPVSAFFMGFVDFLRGLIRPVVTLYLVVLTTLLAWELYDVIRMFEATPAMTDESMDLFNEIVNMVLYLTSASTLWWFGSRPKAKG